MPQTATTLSEKVDSREEASLEGLQVARKTRVRRRPGKSTTTVDRALYPNHVWSYDSVADQTAGGRRLRFLTLIDEFTRESI